MEVIFYRKNFCTLVLLLSLWGTAYAQSVIVKGGFTEDSIRVGQQTIFYLSAKYPSNLTVLFPDTTYNFKPFEYRKKQYMPTRTENGMSYDSVAYYLTTFEVDSIQKLNLPVFQVNPKDCTVYKATADSILISQLVKHLPDSFTTDLPLKATVAYQKVNRQFNYKLFIIFFALLLIIAAIVWFLFGEYLQQHWRIKRMQKAHHNFITAYSRQVEDLKQSFSPGVTERTLTLWKKYMEQLNTKPYTRLTTRETLSLERNEMLGKNLRKVDGAIYGHNTDVLDSLENLKRFAHERYQQKVKEVKHDR